MITTLLFKDSKYLALNPPPESLAMLRAEAGAMLWVDLSEPTPEEIKLVLDDIFQFHPLAIEDCVADTPLPKLEDYDDYLYFVMHAVDYTKTEHFTTTELDIFLGKNYLVTFHRKPLKPVQHTIEKYMRSPNLQVRGPDRFAHQLLDYMVEAYKPALLELQSELDQLEADALKAIPPQELFPRIVALRKEFSTLRQIVRPQHVVASELSQGKKKLIRPLIVPYLRDLVEELSRIEAQSEAWSEQLMLTFRVYLNKSAHDANEGIKVLTGITALTIPVLSVGAWYGMNHKEFPELDTWWGYPAAFVITFGGTLLMLRVMLKRKWI